jgi:hypothetical protein
MSINNQPVYSESTCLSTAFAWQKHPSENALRADGLLARDFLELRLGKSVINVHLKTNYTPWLCRIIQHQPSYHDGFLPCDLKEWQRYFLIISVLIFPLRVAGLQILRPV